MKSTLTHRPRRARHIKARCGRVLPHGSGAVIHGGVVVKLTLPAGPRFVMHSKPIQSSAPDEPPRTPDSNLSVFFVFLKLGLTSFGGPIAHLGYFRDELVDRRRWISDAQYADLVALCQFLPGPASSQVGFALGIFRGGGLLGGLAAWVGFTLPSALLMLAFSLGSASFSGPLADAFLHGLKLVAVAVVAQAIWGMARSLTPDATRLAIALAALTLAILCKGAAGQLGAIAFGALAGLWLCRCNSLPADQHERFPVSRRNGLAALALAGALFVVVPLLAIQTGSQGFALFNAFYRSGALVFGGGHVVLPLLKTAVVEPGWVSTDTFLAGYGLAQAVPGPLFSLAAFLGASMAISPNGVGGATIALVAIFLPGLLLLYGMLPFAGALRANVTAQSAMRGANAAVVGILAAAFYDPVVTTAVLAWPDVAIAVAGFALLSTGRTPTWLAVMLIAATATIIGLS